MAHKTSTTSFDVLDDVAPVYDVIGIGFGPCNLAFAIAARGTSLNASMLFLERNERFAWHPGMMIEGAQMQISFLKDLATLRDPASPFTFLQYEKAKGRLEQFVNLREFYPSRLEFNDYLNWAASHFSEQVRYGLEVTRVSRCGSDAPSGAAFRIEGGDARTGRKQTFFARNVVHAPGGTPKLPDLEIPPDCKVFHSSDFLRRVAPDFPDSNAPYRFAIVGGGQSAGEIAAFLLESYPEASVEMLIAGYAPRPADDSPFVNMQFGSQEVSDFYNLSSAGRAAMTEDHRNTNYGVMDVALIDRLYRHSYDGQIRGRNRFTIRSHTAVCGIHAAGPAVAIDWAGKFSGETGKTRYDGVLLATGYTRRLDSGIFAAILPDIEADAEGHPQLSAAHRVKLAGGGPGGLYLQGLGEHRFGIADSLLSLLPFTASAIVADIEASLPGRASDVVPFGSAVYPPARHVEPDVEKAYAVIEAFRFATMVSVTQTGAPIMTQLPLSLDRSRGSKGVLFGHLDRANPHVAALKNGKALVCFHGPNVYVSPTIYETKQLPTWNSISVHVEGAGRVLDDPKVIFSGLRAIAERSTAPGDPYVLDPNDPQTHRLWGGIVGFEIDIETIVARFKLSQDRGLRDQHLAMLELVANTPEQHRSLVKDYLAKLPETPPHPADAAVAPALARATGA